MNKIVNRFNDEVICKGEESILELAEQNRTNLSRADLSGANLSRANLSRADLSGADLSRANLSRADLSGADLYGADLSGADLYGTNLSGANLYGADLYGADLSGADLYGTNLSGANLYGANFYGADLYGAKIEFWRFPSIRLLSSIDLGVLSDDLTIELFRRDMAAHPKPELFKEWAKNAGECPYQNEDRFWFFQLRKECWKPGKPKMTDVELILAICKEKGWKIKDYLK